MKRTKKEQAKFDQGETDIPINHIAPTKLLAWEGCDLSLWTVFES